MAKKTEQATPNAEQAAIVKGKTPRNAIMSIGLLAAVVIGTLGFYYELSRRGDNMPESLMDCCALMSDRLRNRKKLELDDYRATLGWVMEFWDGALPYRYVCLINGVDPEILQDVIVSNPLLKRDMEDVRRCCFGSLL